MTFPPRRGGRAPWALAVLVGLGLGSSARAQDAGEALDRSPDGGLKMLAGVARDHECLVCHAGDGDPEAQQIDFEAYQRSVHGPYGCISCHKDVEDPTIKHEEPDQNLKQVDCSGCHANEAFQAQVEPQLAPGVDRTGSKHDSMKRIAQEFRDSVHFSKRAEFSCARCHDPHTVRFGMTRGELLDHNLVCLRCHGDEEEFRAFVDEEPPNLDKAHAWLPNRPIHWRTARCVDCHTPQDAPAASHRIVGKEQAVQKCEACHTKESMLTRKSTRFADTEQSKSGFLNRGLAGKAYVIGATRNRYLDLTGIALATATFLGIVGHGMIRVVAARVRRKSAKGGAHS